MASGDSLQRLPLELLETIMGYLSITDICKLSLTNREVAAHIASNTSFRSCFDNKTIELSHEHVEAVAVLTQHPWIAADVQQLRIIGVADFLEMRDTDFGDRVQPDEHWEDTLLGCLTTALTNIWRHSTSRGCLSSLVVDVEYRAEPNYNPQNPLYWKELDVFRRCGRITARVTAGALKKSRLEADQIDLFGNIPQFALVPSEIALFKEAIILETCTSLSLAVSAGDNHAAKVKDNEEKDTSAQVLPIEVIQILNGARCLVHLHLRWYEYEGISLHKRNLKGSSDLLAPIDGLSSCSLPQLKSLSLGGIHTTEKSLLAFLSAHPDLTSLVLQEIHIREGSFHSIFAHIDNQPGLESLYLNDFWEKRLIFFTSASGKPHVPDTGAPTWLERSPSQRLRRRPIRYDFRIGPAKASAAGSNVRRNRRRLYGSS